MHKYEDLTSSRNDSNALLGVVLSNGYIKDGYGFKKQTKYNTHWITLLEQERVQLYAYFTDDVNDSAYNTGVIRVSGNELATLIKVLVGNHA